MQLQSPVIIHLRRLFSLLQIRVDFCRHNSNKFVPVVGLTVRYIHISGIIPLKVLEMLVFFFFTDNAYRNVF